MKAPSSTTKAKILDLDTLAEVVKRERSQGRTIVHSHGVFDLLHLGHIRHFQQARNMGDVLVVTITPDEYVNKGPGRPVFPQDLRAEAVAALGMVDYVSVNRWPLSAETIRLLQPHVYVKGQDYKVSSEDISGGISVEAAAIESVGGTIRFTDEITFSSSSLLNRHFSLFPPEVDQYLTAFRERHSVDEILGWLEKAADLKALVIGDAIVDEYLFCEGIGKSTKDPVLAVLFQSLVPQAGGTLAIANHLAGLCREVCLLTALGDHERREEFVRDQLAPNVEPVLLTKSGSPTIHKRRMVDRYSGNKLFEIYMMNDRPISGADEDALHGALQERLRGIDSTTVADYGHGTISSSTVELLCTEAPFLAVNAQSNAGNRGFNPVSRYRRADYVCLAMHEVAMELRSRYGNLQEDVRELARRIVCPKFTVTMGKAGSLHYDLREGFFEYPALATRVLDRVGAGDAVLAVTSLLTCCGAPWDITGFVGNVAGAELVGELGNRVPLNRVSLAKHITALLK